MAAKLDGDAQALAELLRREPPNGLLRFMICGGDADALLAALLHDTAVLSGGRLAAPGSKMRETDAIAGEPDPTPSIEGLETECEQTIAADLGWRFFATARRSFILPDDPGRGQDTRRMAAAASTADLAVIVIDAERGLLRQTRRHVYIAALLGIRCIVLAVDGMDRVGYAQAAFDRVVAQFGAFAGRLAVERVEAVPVAAHRGDNIARGSERMPWHDGPSLLALLETIRIADHAEAPLRMPVRQVPGRDRGAWGFAGTIAQGSVRPGDGVVVLPSHRRATVARIATGRGDVDRAAAGQAVTLMLDEDVDAGPGDVIASAAAPPEQADQFAVHLVWLGAQPLYPGRPYAVKIGSRTVAGQITELKHKVDVKTLDGLAARHLASDEIAYGTLALDHAIPFEPHAKCRALGGFVLVDRLTDETVGCGMIDFALWRATTVPWQALEITKTARAELNRQKPVVLWFTGLSGAGKSTIADQLSKRLHARGCRTYLLDGDNLRHGLNRDLGFRPEDRVENIRRVGEVSRLFVDAGLIVLVSLISPFRNERMMVREMLEPGEFIEVFVDTPLAECERRDPKGLYARARAGEIRNFTGIDSPYEPPESAEVVLNTLGAGPDDLAGRLLAFLEERGVI